MYLFYFDVDTGLVLGVCGYVSEALQNGLDGAA